MSSNKASNLSAFLSRNFIESRSTVSFNILLQTDQQHSTAEIQTGNKKLRFNTFIKAKNKLIIISTQ